MTPQKFSEIANNIAKQLRTAVFEVNGQPGWPGTGRGFVMLSAADPRYGRLDVHEVGTIFAIEAMRREMQHEFLRGGEMLDRVLQGAYERFCIMIGYMPLHAIVNMRSELIGACFDMTISDMLFDAERFAKCAKLSDAHESDVSEEELSASRLICEDDMMSQAAEHFMGAVDDEGSKHK